MVTALAIADSAPPRRKQSSKIFSLRTFLEPGNPMDFHHTFADNVRRFLRECAATEEQSTDGMPTWRTLLVDEKIGAVVPLYTLEEYVPRSQFPFCDYCRCNGWSNHLVSKRRYHFVIPADKNWDEPLNSKAIHLQNHLLHGLLHCDGFGHLIGICGREGGSSHISGHDLMDLWDRLCFSLRARQVTVEDLSRKKSMDLRLLLGVAKGMTWFGLWGYRFLMGSYGVTHDAYRQAINLLANQELDALIADAARFDRGRGELRHIVTRYRKLCLSDPTASSTSIVTVRDLFNYLFSLKRRAPPPTKPRPPPPPLYMTKRKHLHLENRKKCREFGQVVAELGSRWPVKRLRVAAQVIVEALKEHGGMTRQDVRDVARVTIGDTGLLDFVLKSIGNCVVGGHVVRRSPNPTTRVLEFSIDKNPAGADSYAVEDESDEEDEGDDASTPTTKQVERDIAYIYRSLKEGRPEAAAAVLDSKHWMKTWGLRDEEDDLLRFQCIWVPSEEEMEEMTRALPPSVLVVVDPYTGLGELKREAERMLRDTYCMLEWFSVMEVVGVNGGEEDPVFGCGLESGAAMWVKGEGADMETQLRYEGGEDTWVVSCGCGARDDDGERMLACDRCDEWHHTRCIGISDGEEVPKLFVCSRCGSSIVKTEATP